MRVLVTGANGHIGSAVVAELLSAGHDVVGLVRSDTAAATVRALGAEPLRGSVTDLGLLHTAAAEADGVVHLAYDHDKFAVGDLVSPAETDVRVVQTFGEALAGSGKPFLGIGTDPDGHPEIQRQTSANPRSIVGRAIAGLAGRDIRHVFVAIPPVVHSDRDRSGFLPQMIAVARRRGVSGYVGDGSARWAAVHTLDLARLYRLALESAPAGSQLFAAAEPGVEVRVIAEAIGGRLGLPVRSVPAEQAGEHFAPFPFAAYDSAMPDAGTRALIGWAPRHPGLVADLAADHYFAVGSGRA